MAILFTSAITRVTLLLVVQDTDRWTYFFLPSTFMFFLFGHWARLAAQKLPSLQSPRLAYTSLAACLVIFIVFRLNWNSIAFFVPMTLLAASLPALFKHTKDNAVLNWLGALSYPIYLIHNLVRMQFENLRVFDRLPHFLQSATATMACYLFAVFLAAVVAHYLLETPVVLALRSCGRLFAERRSNAMFSVPADPRL